MNGNATSATRPTRPARITNGDQPWAGPWISANTTPVRPSVAAPAPAKSGRLPAWGSWLSGTWRIVTHSATAASGTLMRKTRRQETASTSQPPRNGPIEVATPVSPDHAPIAEPWSSERKLAVMSDRLPGTRIAPPTPWRARAAISAPMLGARPHSTDAAVNQTSPITNMRRRPYSSPSAPPNRSSALSVRR